MLITTSMAAVSEDHCCKKARIVPLSLQAKSSEVRDEQLSEGTASRETTCKEKHFCVCWIQPTSHNTQEQDPCGVAHVSRAQYTRCSTCSRGTFAASRRGTCWSVVGC